MARRRKQDGGGLLLGLVALIVIAIVFTIVTSLVYGGVFIFLVGFISFVIGSLEEPSPPAYLSKLPALQKAEQGTCSSLFATTEEIGRIHSHGESLGLRLTDKSNNQLFDRRFPEAELLNQQLQVLFSRAAHQSSTLSELRTERENLRAIWKYIHGSWENRTAFLRGFRSGAVAYVPTTLAVAAIPGGLGSQVSANITGLVWFDAPRLKPYYLALICGTVVSAVTALLAGYSLRSDLSARGRLEAWSWLREQETAAASAQTQRDEAQAWQRAGARSENFHRDRGASGASGQRQSSEATVESPQNPWYEILEVSRNATRAEITAAWRAKVQTYHPDLTGKLAPEFKKLAEMRTKEINRAKDEGLAQL